MQDPNVLISAEQLHDNLDDAQLRVLDCRFKLLQPDAGRQAFATSHIPGAVYVDLDNDLAAPVGPESGRHPLPDPDELAKTLGNLGVQSDTYVVVYDEQSGEIAARAWWLLRWLGHHRVSILDGGINGWIRRGFVVNSAIVPVVPTDFVARPRDELVMKTSTLLAAGDSMSKIRLIDGREGARFRGDREPIDTASGHIPGARNLPTAASISADGIWKSSSELRQLWSAVLDNDLDAPYCVMCGSGVTACHLAASAMLAGLREPTVYVGSWSEWVRDPSRAVATGPAGDGDGPGFGLAEEP